MKHAKTVALCGMMAAMSIVIMVLGAVLEIGMYAAPMFAGLCLLPVGELCGRRFQAALWAAVSALALMLVPNVEESLMYLFVFGLYPVIRPGVQRLPRGLRLPVKLLYFNLVTVALEWLILSVLAPEFMEFWFGAVLLVLGNLTFFCYDLVIPMAQKRLGALVRRIMK